MAKKKAVKEKAAINSIPDNCPQDCDVCTDELKSVCWSWQNSLKNEELNVTAIESEPESEANAVPETSEPENGQTSDQSASCDNVSFLPDDYKWDSEPKSIDEFFTYNDYLYLIQDFERQFREFCELPEESRIHCSSYGSLLRKKYKKHLVAIWPEFKDLFKGEIYDELHLSFGLGSPDYNESLKKYKTLSDLKNASFDEFRNSIMDACRLYDFSDLSRVPVGVSDMFVLTCERIDKKKTEIEDNFVSIALYLADLNGMGEVNFKSYGCKNIYDFSERRFGFGRTTTKNFIAIYGKFMEQTTIKEPYRDFSYSQLTELVPVDEKLLPEFTPKMTIKEIRAKKKELLGKAEKVGDGDFSTKGKDAEVAAKKIDVEDLREALADWCKNPDEILETVYKSGYKTAQKDLFDLLEGKFGIDFRC